MFPFICLFPGRRPARAVAYLFAAAAVLLLCAAQADAAERRRDQFPTELGYLVVPAPYSLPGIGTGWVVFAYGANVFGTHADTYLYWITGDAKGVGYGAEEVHLLPKRLLAEVYREDISEAQVQQFIRRGMDTDQNDFVYVDVSDVRSTGGSLRLTFNERRLEFVAALFTQRAEIPRLRDTDGNVTQTFEPPVVDRYGERTLGVQVDFTDDYYDPHAGVKGALYRTDAPSQDADAPDYYTLDLHLRGFVPIGRQSTWGFAYLRSQAVVRSEGETDPTAVALEYCPALDPACLDQSAGLINDTLAGNRHGTSTSLGGRDRLRAYPDGRFQGAFTEWLATELRWNLTSEKTPFDYGIWKDVRTSLQIAFFAETGTVAESAGSLWDEHREDAGIGLRVVTASGGVYRGDVAWGDEGSEVTIIVNYPW